MSARVARRRSPTTSRSVPLAESSTATSGSARSPAGTKSTRPSWAGRSSASWPSAAGNAVTIRFAGCRCSVFGGGMSALDSQRRPLLNVISTTDKRAQPQADDWCRRFGRERTYHITGTTTHPSLMLPEDPVDRRAPGAAAPDRPVCHGGRIGSGGAGHAAQDGPGHGLHDHAAGYQTSGAGRTRSSRPPRFRCSDCPPLIASGRGDRSRCPRSLCRLGLAPGCVLVAGGHDQQVCALGAGLLEAG